MEKTPAAIEADKLKYLKAYKTKWKIIYVNDKDYKAIINSRVPTDGLLDTAAGSVYGTYKVSVPEWVSMAIITWMNMNGFDMSLEEYLKLINE